MYILFETLIGSPLKYKMNNIVSIFISYLTLLLHCRTLPDKCSLSHGMCLYQVMMTLHFLIDVANDAESTQKIENNVIIACLKRETIGKLINRIRDLRLLISSLPGSALRTHFESLGKPRDVNKPHHVNKPSQSLAW